MSQRTRSLAALTSVFMAVGVMLTASAPNSSTLWNDTELIDRIIEIGRSDNLVMEHLDALANGIGMRPAGSRAHQETAEWAYARFKEFGLSNVHLEQCGDYPVDPADDWTEGFLEKLARMVRIRDEDIAEEKRVPVYNVVADIPGTDLPDEYVIIGAHYDSVPIGEGALDNGTGVAAAIEAARILMESGARPRRTIRFVLFAGEEAGLIGSRGYVEDHPELLPRISAMYNMDHGTNYISGIAVTEPLLEDMEAIFATADLIDPGMRFEVELVDWLLKGDPNCCQGGEMAQLGEGGPMVVMQAYKQMPDGSLMRVDAGEVGLEAMGCDGAAADAESTSRRVIISGGCSPGCIGDKEISLEDLKDVGLLSDNDLAEMLSDSSATGRVRAVAIGSSDQSVFLAAGVPGFWWKQEGDSAVAYPVHTASDTFDRVIPEYLEYSATVIALGALGTANLDHMLSRERLTRPESSPEPVDSQAEMDGTSL